MIESKKGLRFYESWPEIFALIFLIVGFLLSVTFSQSIGSAVLSYLTIIACGIISGRIIFQRRNKTKYAYLFIIAVFLLGYLIGNFYGSKKVTIFLFVVANLVSYYAHDKGIIRN